MWDPQFEYAFTDETQKLSFGWTSQIVGFEKMLLFSSGNVSVFLPMGYVSFRKI